MIRSLSGSIRLSSFKNPAFAVRSNFGLTDALRFVRKDACCCASGWNHASCTLMFCDWKRCTSNPGI